METFGLILLGLFIVASFGIGMALVRCFVKKPSGLAWVTSSIVLGFYVSVWVAYVLSVVFRSQLVSLIIIDILGIVVVYRSRKSKFLLRFRSLTPFDLLVLLGSIAASTWIMFKSFHTGDMGVMLIGTNEVFDYGHAISVVRSFSQGANVPYTSPFIAGAPHVYHFLFYFWAGFLERFGLPIAFAFNFPAILGLSTLLIMVYSVSRYFFKSVMAGILAIFFSLTHSTLMFWYFLKDPKNVDNPIGAIWRNASYYFAGPYDGANISIFWTLNVIVNQRHLVFGLSVFFVLYFILLHMLDESDDSNFSSVVLLGVLAGSMFWWHTMLFLAGIFVLAACFTIRKKYKDTIIFIVSSVLIGGIHILPWLWQLAPARDVGGQVPIFSWFLSKDPGSLVHYWWLNLGVAIFAISLGFSVLSKKLRSLVLPFIVLFLLANVVRVGSNMTENHKLINLTMLIGSILSAGGVSWLIEKRGKLGFFLSMVLIALLSISGVIDLMVIKNDFQYPVADYGSSQIMRWVRDNTKSTSTFLSYQDIFDPVALAGRKAYLGFFGGAAYPERAVIAKSIFEAKDFSDLKLLRTNAIDYLVVPKWKKDDFPYVVNMAFFRSNLDIVYEDERHIVFASP